MLSLKVRKPNKENRLYVLRFKLPEYEEGFVYKIGVASGHSCVDRLMQIVRSYFMAYRETPIVKIVRDRQCAKAYSAEKELHSCYSEYRFKPKNKFSGYSELFVGLKEEDLVGMYEKIVKNAISNGGTIDEEGSL